MFNLKSETTFLRPYRHLLSGCGTVKGIAVRPEAIPTTWTGN